MRYLVSAIFVCLMSCLLCEAASDGLLVLRDGESIQDSRLSPPKDLNGYFPMREFEGVEQWKAHADKLRTSLQIAVGLYPMPERTAPNAVIHGRQTLDGYSIENVYFESFPGYYNNLFVVLWSAFEDAQRIIRFEPGGVNASTFATGFAAPIDLTIGPDGAMYTADWATGIIFKIEYVGE